MIYEKHLIEKMNEEDVRANILDVIIRRLGYDFGAEFYVERERPLKYPYTQVGRKSPKDVPTGKSDYICGVDGRRGTFTLEAKRGSHQLARADREQAHSYAAHPEIGSTFYAVFNGQILEIYRTLGGVDSKPILSILNKDFESQFHKIEALLAPASLIDHSAVSFDLGLPLADGFGSHQNVTRGFVVQEIFAVEFGGSPQDPNFKMMEDFGLIAKIHSDLNQFNGIKQPIETGHIARDDDGRIFAKLKFGSHRLDVERNMAVIGIQELMFITDQKTISLDPETPSVFETLTRKTVPQGTVLSVGFEQQLEPIGASMDFELLIRAYGFVEGNKFIGVYDNENIIKFISPKFSIPDMFFSASGKFDITLD